MRLSFVKIFAPGTLALLGVVAMAFGGCSNDSFTKCDENGENCEICDAYGCHPANPTPGTTSSSSTVGSGGSGGGTTVTTGAGGGGGAACDPAVTTCPCAEDDECTAPGTQCIDGLCIPACEFSYQCGPDEVCANGKCVAECDDETPCDAGYACDKGVCVVDPNNPECTEAIPCPDPAEVCIGGLCAVPCATNAECPDGQICDSTSGACIDDPSPEPGCDQTTTCSGVGQICGDDGYCHYPCADVNECKLIDVRFDHCDAGICKTDEEVNPECTIDDPCPVGQDCISNTCL